MAISEHRKKWRYDFLKEGVRYKKGGFKTREEAVVAEAQAKLGVKQINIDFEKLCKDRLADLEARRSKAHFKETDTLIHEQLLPRWGTLPDVTTHDIEKYLRLVSKESMALANRHLKMIKALFYHGVKHHWIASNPAVGIERFSVEKKDKYVPPEEDVEKLLRSGTPEQNAYLTVITFTLARVREINNLKWTDVNFEEGYVTLRTRKTKHKDVAPRKIPMLTRVSTALQSLPRKGEYVFMNKSKKYDYRDKFIKNLCKKLQIQEFMYHALRHYAASKLDAEGVPLTDIQQLLGHERATTTDIYLHSLRARRGNLRESIERLDSPQNSPRS